MTACLRDAFSHATRQNPTLHSLLTFLDTAPFVSSPTLDDARTRALAWLAFAVAVKRESPRATAPRVTFATPEGASDSPAYPALYWSQILARLVWQECVAHLRQIRWKGSVHASLARKHAREGP